MHVIRNISYSDGKRTLSGRIFVVLYCVPVCQDLTKAVARGQVLSAVTLQLL